MPNSFSNSSMRSYGLRASRSSLLIKVNMGMCRMAHILKSLRVCGSMPFAASMTMTAESAAISVRYVSSEKSWWPGVSRMLIQKPSYSNCITDEVIDIPRCFSSSIQSDTAWRAVALPLTEPAVCIAPP